MLFFLFPTYINDSGNFCVQQSEESYKWENLEPRQLQSAFPCFSRRCFLPWRRLPSTSPHRDDGAGQGPLAPGRTPEARSGAGNPPSLLFPCNALQRFLKTCAQLAGVSPGHPSCWWRRAAASAVLAVPPRGGGYRHLPRDAAQRPAVVVGAGSSIGCRKKKKSKKTVRGRGEDGGRLQLEQLAATQRPSFRQRGETLG